MTVKLILDKKGRNVITISHTASVKTLVDCLTKEKIGAIVVSDKTKGMVGIVSERDIVRSLSKHGASGLDLSISDIMTKKPAACKEDETIDVVMNKMTEGRFRHMPVVHQGNLVGMISIGDVVKAKIEAAEAEKEELIGYMHQ